jgi:hypothetical protein
MPEGMSSHYNYPDKPLNPGKDFAEAPQFQTLDRKPLNYCHARVIMPHCLTFMTNRLADSPSLYLRKHAENPIDWWPGAMRRWSEPGPMTSQFFSPLATQAATGARYGGRGVFG